MFDLFLAAVAVILVFLCLIYGYGFFTWCYTKVPYITTSKKIATAMIKLAKLKGTENVYDLGCGDGKILFLAEKNLRKNKHHLTGKYAGYELIPFLVWAARCQNWLIKGSLQFFCQNFFRVDLSDANVVFCYLWPSIMDRFYEHKWPELKSGTKVISHAFAIKDLKPVKVEKVGRTKIYLYQK